MTWNVWRLWELTLHKYLTNIYLCWKFTLHTSTLLSISGHFKRFQLNHPPCQLTKFINVFCNELSAPPEFFSFLRAWTLLKKILTQFLYCEFFESFKNIFFIEHLWTTASAKCKYLCETSIKCTRTTSLFVILVFWICTVALKSFVTDVTVI